jgi:hypothetical protein
MGPARSHKYVPTDVLNEVDSVFLQWARQES